MRRSTRRVSRRTLASQGSSTLDAAGLLHWTGHPGTRRAESAPGASLAFRPAWRPIERAGTATRTGERAFNLRGRPAAVRLASRASRRPAVARILLVPPGEGDTHDDPHGALPDRLHAAVGARRVARGADQRAAAARASCSSTTSIRGLRRSSRFRVDVVRGPEVRGRREGARSGGAPAGGRRAAGPGAVARGPAHARSRWTSVSRRSRARCPRTCW